MIWEKEFPESIRWEINKKVSYFNRLQRISVNILEKLGNTIYKALIKEKEMVIRRGDVYYADLRPVVGSEQGGIRPVLIIQNDIGNKHSPTVICAAITSKMNKAKLPTHVEVSTMECNMVKDSVILLEQLRTIDKRRLKDKICHIDGELLEQVNQALLISLELST